MAVDEGLTAIGKSVIRRDHSPRNLDLAPVNLSPYKRQLRIAGLVVYVDIPGARVVVPLAVLTVATRLEHGLHFEGRVPCSNAATQTPGSFQHSGHGEGASNSSVQIPCRSGSWPATRSCHASSCKKPK